MKSPVTIISLSLVAFFSSNCFSKDRLHGTPSMAHCYGWIQFHSWQALAAGTFQVSVATEAMLGLT